MVNDDARDMAAPPANSAAPQMEVTQHDGTTLVELAGIWTTRTVGIIDAQMRELGTGMAGAPVVFDLSGITKMDTAGAWVIERAIRSARNAGAEVDQHGVSATARILLAAVGERFEEPPLRRRRGLSDLVLDQFEALGRAVIGLGKDLLVAMHILGATIRGAQMKLGRGHGVNFAAIVSQIDRMGVGALPVVILMSTIVGAIVAQQGAFQLRYFGAEIFVVDLVGILVLREMGVLLTAIMIAGRSGSAITAEIGSMRMREEIDALTVIGLNPIGVLVFPRLVALVVALPCLTIAADFAALGGAIAIAYFYSGIEPSAFIDRLHASIDLSTIFAGLIKAPFMAMIIGIIGSVEGLKVGGSAESLGQHVTSSVVKSIFVVVILDGFFAIFFAAINF